MLAQKNVVNLQIRKVSEQTNDRVQELELKLTDEKGFTHEMIDQMKKVDENFSQDLNKMTEQIYEKTEKIGWFERKLNKWIKLFEGSE